MAELIPLNYRLRVASRRRIERWVLASLLTSGVCAAIFLSCLSVNIRARAVQAALHSEHTNLLPVLNRANEFCIRRAVMAERMATIQRLRDDKTLLAALTEISNGISTEVDHLDYIHLSNSVESPEADKDKKILPGTVAKITGITDNSTTMGELMTRLGQQTPSHMGVVLESSRSEKLLDGHIMRFQLTCQRALGPNGEPTKAPPL